MAVDGRLLARAKKKLEERKAGREAEISRRTGEVYAAAPQVRELDAQIRNAMIGLVDAAFGADTGIRAEDVRSSVSALQDERRRALEKAGFEDDYLDDEHICNLCGDTGYVRNASPPPPYKMCDCLKKLYKAEKSASLSNLLKLGNATFNNFNLSYYDDTPAPGTGISPRQAMEKIYEFCVRYARKFNDKSMNLFFNGAPGLGKTFLSACIARVVSDKEYSVVYDMAGSIFSVYEDLQFSKVKDLDETREEIRRYLECDLLIIDDLGTEMTKAPVIEALYEIINTRLITNRKTIVNSNLTLDEMRGRYSEQIMSRLEGEYEMLTFHGDDIRKKKSRD